MPENSAAAGGTEIAPIPAVYTNQQLINAFYYAAEALGIADYRQLLASAGLNLECWPHSVMPSTKVLPSTNSLRWAQPSAPSSAANCSASSSNRCAGWASSTLPMGLTCARAQHAGAAAGPPQATKHSCRCSPSAATGCLSSPSARQATSTLPMSCAASPPNRLALSPDDPSPTGGGSTSGGAGNFAPPPEEQVTLPPGASSAMRGRRGLEQYGGALKQEAQRLQIDPTLAAALLAAESSGQGYGPDGRLLIRFEIHIFYDQWGKNNQAQFFTYFKFDAESALARPSVALRPQWRVAGPSSRWPGAGVAGSRRRTPAGRNRRPPIHQHGAGPDHGLQLHHDRLRRRPGDVPRLSSEHRQPDRRLFPLYRNEAPGRGRAQRRPACLCRRLQRSGQADAYADILRAYAAALRQLRTPARSLSRSYMAPGARPLRRRKVSRWPPYRSRSRRTWGSPRRGRPRALCRLAPAHRTRDCQQRNHVQAHPRRLHRPLLDNSLDLPRAHRHRHLRLYCLPPTSGHAPSGR